MGDKESRWREFGAIVVKLTRGQDISREEAKECWRQICEEEQSDLQQGGFIGALKAKGETPEEVFNYLDTFLSDWLDKYVDEHQLTSSED